jgi:hypothetical protein
LRGLISVVELVVSSSNDRVLLAMTAGLDVKVERAKEHIGDLEIAIKGWRASDPYLVTMECDVQT